MTLILYSAIVPGSNLDQGNFFSLPFFLFLSFLLFFLSFFQAVNRIPSRKNREMITSFYSQVLQFEQAAGRE